MTRFLIPIILFLAAVGIFFGYVTGGYDRVKVLRSDVVKYDEALAKAQQLKSVRDKLNATYRTFSEDDMKTLGVLLPDNLDNIRVALDLDTIADAHNLRVTKLALADEGIDEQTASSEELVQDETLTLGTAMLTFDVEGLYRNLVSFLTDLEKNVRVVDITDLKFTEGDAGTSQVYTVGIRMYWLK